MIDQQFWVVVDHEWTVPALRVVLYCLIALSKMNEVFFRLAAEELFAATLAVENWMVGGYVLGKEIFVFERLGARNAGVFLIHYCKILGKKLIKVNFQLETSY